MLFNTCCPLVIVIGLSALMRAGAYSPLFNKVFISVDILKLFA